MIIYIIRIIRIINLLRWLINCIIRIMIAELFCVLNLECSLSRAIENVK